MKIRWEQALLGLLCFSAPSAGWAASVPPRTPEDVSNLKLGEIAIEGVRLTRSLPEIVDADDGFVELLGVELASHGYPVAAPSGESADYFLKGSWSEVRCAPVERRTCGAVIDWSLQDRRGRRVYRVKSRVEETELETSSPAEVTEKLLVNGVRSLLSRSRFRSVLQNTGGGAEDFPPARVAACASQALSLPEDSESAIRATAVIRTKKGVGSAVVVSPDGFLLSAAHVVGQNEEVTVIFRDGKRRSARVVRSDPIGDVALLRLQGEGNVPCLRLELDELRAGQELYVIGSPAGEQLSFSISRGILSGRRTIDRLDYLQTDASVNPGNSGGPLVDKRGRVVGIVSWKLSGKGIEGLGFAVPSSSTLQLLSLEMGQRSSDFPTSESAWLPQPKDFVDSPDPAWTLVGVGGASPSAWSQGETPRRGTPAWVPLAYSVGGAAVVTGAVMISVSALSYQGIDRESYFRARDWNDAGWIVAGAGVGAIAAALILPRVFEEKPSSSSARARVEPIWGATSWGVRVRY